MSNTNKPESAFPSTFKSLSPEEEQVHRWGMTLRDYFAAKAMQGLIARESAAAFNFEACPNDPWRVALWAYDVADQMLKVREA